MDDGALEPGKIPTSAGAGHRLGPKANTGAINAGLRAIDRTGAPCHQLKSFTGVLWQLPSWRSPKRPKIDENAEVMISFSAKEFPIELYSLCKDQHGCKYLQRKLEERHPEHIQMIFEETNVHVVELMTDPFGNYLCQKLLEYSNDEKCTALINNTAPQFMTIALNQHGTLALQKMIEFISTPEQTQTVTHALENHVVMIQRCLNRLSAEDSQLVYDAMGTNCVVVHSEGPISTNPIRKINGFRGSKEFHLNQATQHRLILSNIRNLRFNGVCSTNPVLHNTNLHYWAAIVKETSVCTSCAPDRKNIHDKCSRESDGSSSKTSEKTQPQDTNKHSNPGQASATDAGGRVDVDSPLNSTQPGSSHAREATETLGTYNIKNDHTVHLAKSASSNQCQNVPTQSSSTLAPTGVPSNLTAGTGNDPLIGLTGARYAGFTQLPGCWGVLS